ncbi:MAG: AbrB/MazE/SpoVT family DNA-binding domain-containing protein [Clostridia bacterium]|nr:AbrB/MazE/SpoVT family DNA-binding domain-containing protein [Clostridia bacterium]
MSESLVRLTSKGQMTIPQHIRESLGLKSGDYLAVEVEENEIRLRKVRPIKPLSEEDPIWKLVGIGDSGLKDVAANHDRYLAEGEKARWKK